MLISFSSGTWHLSTLPVIPKAAFITMMLLFFISQQASLNPNRTYSLLSRGRCGDIKPNNADDLKAAIKTTRASITHAEVWSSDVILKFPEKQNIGFSFSLSPNHQNHKKSKLEVWMPENILYYVYIGTFLYQSNVLCNDYYWWNQWISTCIWVLRVIFIWWSVKYKIWLLPMGNRIAIKIVKTAETKNIYGIVCLWVWKRSRKWPSGLN